MENINAYIKEIMNELDENGFFQEFGLFMDKKIFKKFLTKVVNDNFNKTMSPIISEDQFTEIIEQTNHFMIEETFQDLLKKDLIEVAGVDENGDFLYSAKKI